LDGNSTGNDPFLLAEEISSRWPGGDGISGRPAILLMTSSGWRGDAARCREAGISAYLIKPIKQSELLEALLAVLHQTVEPGVPPALVTRHSLRESRSSSQVSVNKYRILLAEDNPINQKVARLMLEEMGHVIDAAANGKEALARLRRKSFDLILMDVQMPEIDGFETTSIIRAEEKRTGKHIPIIAMTANALKGDEELCLKKGMDGYVSKPVRFDLLASAIDNIMRGRLVENAPLESGKTDPPVFDKGAALSGCGGKNEVLKLLVSMFLDECPSQVEDIQKAVAARNASGLRQAAHRFKGSASQIGAHSTQAAAFRLEVRGRENNLTGVEADWQDLLSEVEKLKSCLEPLR
jgi:CheY-like chemotaxis protein/HPt (histidine-containing phosphotransfer) domain-containing protein